MADDEITKEDLDLLGDDDKTLVDPKPDDPPADPKPSDPPADPPKDPEPKELDPPKPDSWRDTITDEKLKNIASRYDSPASMAKAIQDLRSSDRVRVPGDDASDEEKAEFRKAIGVPETPEGYEYQPPDDLEATDADKALVEKLVPAAHASGIPKDALSGFLTEALKLSHALEEEQIAAMHKARDDGEAALRKLWPGDEFETNMNLANRAATTLNIPGLSDFVNLKIAGTDQRLGDHPVLAQTLAFIQRQTSEDTAMPMSDEERQSVSDEISELNRKVPPGTDAYRSPAHQRKLQELYRKQAGDGSIVGVNGRTN